MVPKQLGVPMRFLLAAAAAGALLVPSMDARAQEAPFGGSDGFVRPVAEPAAANAAIPPRITSMRHRWIGSAQERFLLDIRFSQSVTGFAIGDIQVFGANAVPPLVPVGSSGASYQVTMDTRADYEGPVIIEIPANAAQNAGGEGNIAASRSFDADNRAPAAIDAEVDGAELTVTFSEALDERFVPPAGNFDVDVTRGGASHAERVSRVEVRAAEVILTLARAVRFGDVVELSYDDLGARALRDRVGNPVPLFVLPVANDTRRGEAPGPPRNLAAVASSSTAIQLSWRAPLNPGSSPVVGYWIEVSADGGTTWSTLVRDARNTATRYRHTELAPDTTLHYRVSAINSYDTGSPSNVASATTELRPPDAPGRLTALALGTSAIELDWTAPPSSGTAAVTGYRIEWSRTGNSPWRALEADTERTATAYTHRDLNPGTTRHYRVAAISTVGRGDWSNIARATTEATRPDAPTGLRAVPSGLGGNTRLLLSWTRPASDGGSPITGYRIETSPNGVSSWIIVEAGVSEAATTYLHTDLAPGTTRYYRVAAINAKGRGAYSNLARGATRAGAPGPPRSLRARADGPTSITLTWEAPTSDGGARITGYRIRTRGSRDGAWTTIIANTGETATTFTHTDLKPATAHRYQVAAINSVDAGEWSSEAATVTRPDVPDAPTGLTARAIGPSRIYLSWRAPRNDNGAPVIGYRVEVSIDGRVNWQTLRGNTGSNATTFTDPGLAPGTRRHYRVSAINSAGTGAPSTVAWATTEAVLPGAPRSVVARTAGSSAIEVSWVRPSDDGGATISGYRIEGSRNRSSGWTIVGTQAQGGGTTFRHTGLMPGTTWYYRVSAVNSKGAGPASAVSAATTDATVPGLPRTLTAAAAGPNAIDLAWAAPATDGGAPITGYRIEEAATPGGPWNALVPNSGSRATTFTHAGLPPVTTRYYRVSAINSTGVGQAVGPVSATTLADVPAAPINLRATPTGTSRITLSWTIPINDGGARISGYRIEVSADGGATWTNLRLNTGSRATSFLHSNLQPASTRHYRVSAINAAGVGAASNVARATTEATRPAVPGGLTAQADGTSRIDLSWQAPRTDGGAPITGYRIEVSEDRGANWRDLVANTRHGRTTYAHTDLEPASTRHYRVSAINRIGVGRASRIAIATTDATVPDAPTGLVATAASPTRIDLTWVAPAYDGGAAITGYRIEVSETGAAWTVLVPHSGNAGTLFSHVGLRPGSERSYRVSAVNRAGTGAASGVASAATDDPVQRAGRLNTRVLPHVAAAMTSSTVSAIARRVDAVANGMGMERRVETNGLSSMAASLSSPDAGGLGLAQGDGLAALFGGTSFTMPLGASDAQQQSATGMRLASWGAGEYHHLGEPGQSTLDWKGNMVSAHAGIDARVGPDILAGVAGSYSSGSFDFTDKTGASPVRGTYGATMTGVHPYMAWFSGAGGASVWGSAGLGRGEIEVDDEREGLRTSPASMLTGAGGAGYQLFTSGIGGVRLKGEGWYGQVTVDGSEQIEAVTLEMQRGKLAVELTQGFSTQAGHEMAFVLEGGMRYDNGDGVNGASAEVGGGLRYTNAGLGLTAEGRGRFVISGRDDYEEWGVGGTLMLDPATRGEGLSIRVAPSYGDHRSGMNQLWERGVHDAVGGHDLGMGPDVDGEIAYGIAGFQGTPYSGFYLGESVRAFSSGVRYDLGAGVGLRLEGTRRESGPEGARHSVGIRGRIRLR